MNKADLKTGMVVVTRMGNNYRVIRDCEYCEDMIYSTNNYNTLVYYGSDLINSKYPCFDIMAVYKPTDRCALFNKYLKTLEHHERIWERIDYREVTFAELEQAITDKFGNDFKVVKE